MPHPEPDADLLALDFEETRLRVHARTPGGAWRAVGEVDPEAADARPAVARLLSAAGIAGQGAAVRAELWLPRALVHVETLPASGDDARDAGRAALAARFGDGLADLHWDVVVRPGVDEAILAAVDARTVEEARAHARRLGFTPGRVTIAPAGPEVASGPCFDAPQGVDASGPDPAALGAPTIPAARGSAASLRIAVLGFGLVVLVGGAWLFAPFSPGPAPTLLSDPAPVSGAPPARTPSATIPPPPAIEVVAAPAAPPPFPLAPAPEPALRDAGALGATPATPPESDGAITATAAPDAPIAAKRVAALGVTTLTDTAPSAGAPTSPPVVPPAPAPATPPERAEIPKPIEIAAESTAPEPPRARPPSVLSAARKAADAEKAAREAEAARKAALAVPRPRPRPAPKVDATAVSRATASVGSQSRAAGAAARQATLRDALPFDETALIGVFGGPGGREALLRLASGELRKVSMGSRIDGWTVSEIGDSSLRLRKGAESRRLSLP